MAFHFTRFRPLRGDWWWQSGQLQCGVMPWRLRQFVYGPCWRALAAARAELAARRPGWDFPRQASRTSRAAVALAVYGFIMGGTWLRVGDTFIAGRLGLGRWSGRLLVLMQRLFAPATLRMDAPPSVSTSQTSASPTQAGI